MAVLFVLALLAASGVERVQETLDEIVSRDKLCGSALDRNYEHEFCSEDSWAELCAELRDAQPPRHDEDVDAGLRTAEFVGQVAYDLLCRTEDVDTHAEPVESKAAPDEAWDSLKVIGRHDASLQRAVEAFAAELRSAIRGMGFALADLNYGARFFRGVQDSAEGRVRITDDEGEDASEILARSLVQRGERAIREVREFRSGFAHRRLAEFEVADAEARLWNGLSSSAWGLANAIDSDEVVNIPLWLTGEEIPVPGSEVAIPLIPPVFRLGTPHSPLEDPSVLSESPRVLHEFLKEDPEKADCARLERAMDALDRRGHSEIERLDRTDNPAGFRSARSELIRFNVLKTLSRGNQTLIDACGRDRNALQWHRRFLQQTADLTGDLHPGLGEILRSLLQNTFAERIESSETATGSALLPR